MRVIEQPFKYFAFISYSRKDSRAAAFLHRKLEKFRIPVKRVPAEARQGLGKFVRPIFRDKRDLEIGESSFTEDVKKALKDSRYIIVLCSQNSAQSVWVNNEIKYFLETHDNDLTKVVPVVLSGNPDSGDGETECLCEFLLSEKMKSDIVKRNLPTMVPDEGEDEKFGWEAGVVGVLSYLLKVKRQDIKATIDAEKVRQMRIYAAIGIVCSTIFAGLAFWAVRAERTAKQNWLLAEENKRQAIEQRDRAVEAERLADANRRKAEENEKRAVAEEKRAKEKAFLASKTVDFLKRMLQEAKPDEHGAKNVIDLLAEQQSKVDLLEPPELRYSVSLALGQIMLEQALVAPASRMLKYAYDFCKANEKMGKEELAGVANLLALSYNGLPGRSEEALALLSEVEGLRRQQGEDDFSMAMTYLNMAASYFAKKDYVKSRELCEKILAYTGGKPCRATLLAFSQGASIALELGEYAKGEELCEKAFAVSEEMHKEPDDDLIETLVLAMFRNGKLDLAERKAKEFLPRLQRRGVVTRAAAALENDLGLIADARGDQKKAIEHYQNAVKGYEKLWPDGHSNLANIINNLGIAYLKAGGAHMAILALSRAVEMVEKLEGKNSIMLYTPLVNLGAAYKKNGEYDTALSVLERAHDICVKKFGANAAQLSGVIFHMADLNEMRGRNEEAKTGYEETLRILRLHNQTETELAISSMGSLAGIYFKGGAIDKAKELIDEAVRLARQVLPVGNEVRQVVMRAYEWIVQRPRGLSKEGSTVSEINWNVKKAEANKALTDSRNDEAETLYLELLHHLEGVGQTFTTEYAHVCNQLGVIAERKGKLREALAYYARSRDTDYSIKGTNDIEVAITCKNMADVLKRLGDSLGEEEALRRALPAYEAASQAALSDMYTRLGRINESQKKLPDALEWYRKALAFDVSLKGTNSVDVAVDYEDIGDVQNASGEHAAAAESYRVAMTIRLAIGESAESKKIASLENDIGNALWRGKEYRSAVEHYRRSYEIDSRVLGLTNQTTVTVLANLGSCEKDIGDYTNAIAHLTLAANMKKLMKEFDAHSYGLTMNALAIAHSNSGDHEGALRTFFVALDYDIGALGRENENVMTVYGNIALEYQKMGRNAEAVGYFRKALDIALLLHGENNEVTRLYYRGLGDSLYSAKKYDKCAAIRRKYLDVVREDKSLRADSVAKAHELYADALASLDDYKGAASNRVLAVRMYRESGNEFLESVAISLCLLGDASRQLGDFKEAAEAYAEAKKLYEENHFKYEKGSCVDLGIHRKLEECIDLVAGRMTLVVKMTKIIPKGQAERLGVREGDVWCSLDDWKADDYPDGTGLWNSLVKFMAHFQGKPRRLTVFREVNGEWVKLTFLFDGSVGGFVYGYDVMPAKVFNAMKPSRR